MHLTTEEVALISVVIGGLIGSLSATIRDRSIEDRDHLRRLWEREVEFYETLLLQIDETIESYSEIKLRLDLEKQGREFLLLGKGKKQAEPLRLANGLDLTLEKRVHVQMVMFARPEVIKAREECEHLHDRALLCQLKLDNSGARGSSQYAVAREQFLSAIDAAFDAQLNLTDIIRTATRSAPTREGRKRLKWAVLKWKIFRKSQVPSSKHDTAPTSSERHV